MKVSIRQIYIKPGIGFPFSHLMQGRVTSELSALFGQSRELEARYGSGYDLTVNVSADTGIAASIIKGPSVFKKTKDVEYTLFLPYDTIMQAHEGCRSAMEHLMAGVSTILGLLGIDATPLVGKKTSNIVESICSDPTMFIGPWGSLP